MYFKALYIKNRFFIAVSVVVILFVLAFFFPWLQLAAQVFFFILVGVFVADYLMLFGKKTGIKGHRFTPEKLSNGDDNEIRAYLENRYAFTIYLKVIDELPHQFQLRDNFFEIALGTNETETISYPLRPVKRGEYSFGAVNVFASSMVGLVARRYQFSNHKMVPVYPSFIQMRKYELLAISNTLTEYGIKKIRRIGHNLEFEQIKEYVQGDDFRTINWRATARRGELMVNNYQDERSQQVYSLIDKSRTMQMPFEGMTLLDYAINASLVISNIAIKKEDKAGLMTFQHKVAAVLPASRRPGQMHLIQEVLYKEKTAFKEADFSRLYAAVRNKITRRSLLLLFTNFETTSGMQRQLPYLKRLAKSHLVVVIFFKNTEMNALLENKAGDVKTIYNKAIAENLMLEKQLIVKQLAAQGLHAILTAPENLTVNTINKYLELKSRGLI